ncbi:Clavaminate synthase-like protein [Exidia glandulosa HHB12029]|uniref:Clavaminate synthase-like protein n=1 Tax=Exidia glandulosa HHB12029 TaxID=1314781 RepID=A0A165QAV4_EXIGL|nr:Clavaminate synthase-like protein [Exidia glandulosa HHB12029]
MPLTLPVISIAPYVHRTDTNEAERRATSAALHEACVNYGFFYLDISSFASHEETDELERLAHQFFELPQDAKDVISIENEDLARGYQRLKQNVTNGKADAHEGIDFYRPVEQPEKGWPLWGENQWPSDEVVPKFKATYEVWVEKMKQLGLIVMEAMAAGLGLTAEEWLDLRSKVDNSFWVMRVIGYPPLPNDHDGFSCGSHKDYGCLTFLHADSTPSALQVFLPASTPALASAQSANAKHGDAASANGLEDTLPREQGVEEGVWLMADPKPGCVVCNIGEMWEIWTQGLYRSTLHRVIHRGSNYRVSVPFFFEPNYTARIAPLPAAIRAWEKLGGQATTPPPNVKRDPVVYGDFLRQKVAGNFEESGPDLRPPYPPTISPTHTMDPVPTFVRGETVWLWTSDSGNSWTQATVLSINNAAKHESARNISYNVIFFDRSNRKVATTVGPALIRRCSPVMREGITA